MNYREIKDYPNYLVSECGCIYSIKSKRNIKPCLSSGYLRVLIFNNSGSKLKLLHRIIAEAFIENPDGLPIVNHKDGNKLNNSICNLEWVTQQDNILHSINLSGWKGGRPKGFKLSDQTKKIMSEKKIGKKHPKFKGIIHTPYGEYESSYLAEKAIGISRYTIRYRCSHESFPDWYIKN